MSGNALYMMIAFFDMVSDNFDITREDLETFIYWTSQKYRVDSYHRNSSSGKSDLIGAFYDRWMSRLSEYVVFQNLLKDKEYEPVIDFYLYNQNAEKNAPDILGLRSEEKLVKLCEFEDAKWNMKDDKPFIEVKEFKASQNLVTIPEPEFKNTDYFVITVSDMNRSYLVNFLQEEVFSKSVYKNLKMDESFLKDKEGIIELKDPDSIEYDQDLGSIELLAVLENDRLKEISRRFGDQEDAMRIDSVEPTDSIRTGYHTKAVEEEIEEGYNDNKLRNNDDRVVPFHISKKEEGDIFVRSKSGSSMYIEAECGFEINGEEKESGIHKIQWRVFERGGNSELIMHMSDLRNRSVDDDQEKLMERLNELFNSH